MPNSLAHTLVVKNFYLKEGGKNFADFQGTFLFHNYEPLNLGSLGPDPLFYLGILPPKLHLPTAKKRIGNKLHKLDGRELFRALLEEAVTIDIQDCKVKKYSERERNSFKAFVFGQFAHYLLDREAHPYILYESGFDENGKITGKYHYQHAYFESQIDVVLAKKYGLKGFLENPSEIYSCTKNIGTEIDFHFGNALKRIYPEIKLPKDFYSNALQNMSSLIRFMNHQGKLKAKLVGKNNLASLALPTWDCPESVLNLDHDLWRHPVTGKLQNDSFYEMMNRCISLLSNLYHDIETNGFNYATFEPYLNGLDYYGAIPGEKWVYKKENEKKDS